jgi:hypothetical protein
LAYADAYADLLLEKNIVRWLKNNSSEQGVNLIWLSLILSVLSRDGTRCCVCNDNLAARKGFFFRTCENGNLHGM